jgi:hypothetical protein
MHDTVDTQDTPFRLLKAPPGSGIGTMDHLTPFHISTNGEKSTCGESRLISPTAAQKELDTQLTPKRLLSFV